MADLNIEINDNIQNNEKKLIPCRCPSCYLIPSITMYEEENNLKLKFKCSNNHEFDDEFNTLYKKSKIDLDNKECNICNVKKLKNKFYFCSICNNFYCKKCKNEHKKENNHLCININKYDSRCKIHNKDLIGYCKEHKMNYCDYCPKYSHEFERHQLIYEKEMNEYLEIIKNCENKINNNNKELNLFINKIEDLLKIIKNIIKTSQINQLIEINFQKEIINTYIYMKDKKNLNYQIIENVRNIIKYPIKTELNKDINDIIYKYNNLYNNFTNEIKNKLSIKKENDKFKDFNFEKMNNLKTLNNNQGSILCLKTLDDGRLAAGDYNSNLIIYDSETFNPDIVIKNNLSQLLNLNQLKNKNLVCSFSIDNTFKIIKIKNKNEYEVVQLIKNAHNKSISKIIELTNENLITFSIDCSFKVWNINSNNNMYEKINEFKDTNYLSDGLEIKDNEILYSIATNPNSLVFFNLNKNEKIKTISKLNLSIWNVGSRIIKINNDEIIVAGDKKIYLININNYNILNEINSDNCNICILKLSNNLFLTGDDNGTITQYKTENKHFIKVSYKNKSHENYIYSMTILKDMIISGGKNSNKIKIWKE